MKYILLTLGFTLLFIFSMAAQDTITIHFAPQYQRSNDGGHGFMKLLRYDPDSIFYDGVPRQIQLPDQFFVSDTAVAFNFFTGWENPKIENATAFLFGNYSSHRPIVYIDYNHNLDFRDDGQALQFTTDSTVIVYLKNSSHQHAYFPIKFFYPNLLPEQKTQIEPMFSQMGPDAEGNEIISIDYWLADQRFNYKITDTWINGQSVKIGLFDWDCNGLYNDKGQDRIMLGNYEENFISGKLDKGAIVFQDTTLIEIGTQVYKVLDIGPAGDFLKLRKTNAAYLKPISIGDQVSEARFKMIDEEKERAIQFYLNKGKYLLLDFWGTWCRGCTQQLPSLQQLQKNHMDQLQIIGLNYGDTKATIHKYITKHQINWPQAFANESLLKQLRIDGFPNYMLIDKNGNVLLMNASIEEIQAQLQRF